MCLKQNHPVCSDCDDTMLLVPFFKLFPVDYEINRFESVKYCYCFRASSLNPDAVYFVMERVNQSKVWKHFTRDYNDEKAKCIYCSQNMSCKGGSTSGLFRHLKT